ncbi:vanillate monooxygenase [Pusillimonas sp. T2]|uniref:aromatic ring-hydroxylating dioxygenase subunit alpha n=1 Tax=Pusillimonas sp. T2 TaxID=1548123 RepID=UPI000B9CB404|nr:aromatic ring-hydroxylating dioxygenase subunit alpha [Pusillimonas sp. T2]OXR50720.1 vanillate monooxygenase [Pusillimonas sp. T2]
MNYLRNTWYAAMWSQDLEPGQIVGRIYLGEQVVLFRSTDGKVSALDDICPHRFAPLHKGYLVDGCKIRCGYHGLEFDGSGACVRNPHGKERIPSAAHTRAYPVAEKHSMIWIWMGDQAADPDLIPDFQLIDDAQPELVSRRDWMKMEAGFELVVDNLMDLSHTSFLHDGLLGNEATIKSDTKVEQNGNRVSVDRIARNVPVTKFHDLQFLRDGQPVDLWTNITWQPPACLVNDNGVTRPGASRVEGTGVYGIHFLTPETETTCWYHFVAVRQNPVKHGEPLDTQIREQIAEMRRYAFVEQDHDMIRAQQQAMLRAGRTLKEVSLESDVGIERYKRVLRSMMEAERAQTRSPSSGKTQIPKAIVA